MTIFFSSRSYSIRQRPIITHYEGSFACKMLCTIPTYVQPYLWDAKFKCVRTRSTWSCGVLIAEKAWCKHIVYVRWSVISLYHFGSESFNLFDLLCFTLDFCHGWEKGRVAARAKILQSFDYFSPEKKKLHSTDQFCLKVDHGLAQRRMYQYRFTVVCNALGSNFCPDMKTSRFLSNYNKANSRSSQWNS